MKLWKTHVRKTARRDVYVNVNVHVNVNLHVNVNVQLKVNVNVMYVWLRCDSWGPEGTWGRAWAAWAAWAAWIRAAGGGEASIGKQELKDRITPQVNFFLKWAWMVLAGTGKEGKTKEVVKDCMWKYVKR